MRNLLEFADIVNLKGPVLPRREVQRVSGAETYAVTFSRGVGSNYSVQMRTTYTLSDCDSDCDCQGTDCSECGGGDCSDCNCTSDYRLKM